MDRGLTFAFSLIKYGKSQICAKFGLAGTLAFATIWNAWVKKEDRTQKEQNCR